jgi:hypothetical protein
VFWSDDAGRVALKFQVGGWRASYVHFIISLTFAMAVALIPVAIGFVAVRVVRRKAN